MRFIYSSIDSSIMKLNKKIYKNKYQMPNIHELVDNVAAQISKTPPEKCGSPI